MAIDDRIPQLKAYLPEYLARLGVELNSYKQGVCPLCGSGTGAKKTGAFSVRADGQGWTCFSCGERGDVFDLAEKVEGLDKAGAIEHLAAIFLDGADVPNRSEVHPVKAAKEPDQPAYFDTGRAVSALWSEAGVDVLGYLRERGLSDAVLKAQKVGAWYVGGGKMCAAFPYLDESGQPTGPVFWRATEGAERGYLKGRGYSQTARPYNVDTIGRALQERRRVFVVEAQIDALTLETLGFHAVATSSTSGLNHFLRYMKEPFPCPDLVLMLDNDEAGRKAQAELSEGLTALGFPHVSFYWGDAELSEGYDLRPYKDPNEAAKHDREGLILALRRAEEGAKESEQGNTQEGEKMSAERQQDAQKETFFSLSIGEELDDILTELEREPEPQPTGFKGFDRLLKGGLPSYGLFVIGAAPATGKTALALTIAQNVAASGGHSLFISCEMAKRELITRILCGLSGQDQNAIEGKIKAGKRAELEGLEHFRRDIAPRLFVEEMEEPTIETIAEKAKAFAQTYRGKNPVVFVDYLQLIRARDPIPGSREENRNRDTLTRLSYVSRQLKMMSKHCPVIVISSVNRAAYYAAPSMEALKESGDIEFSCDWAGILTYAGYTENQTENQRHKKEQDEKKVKALKLHTVKGRRWPVGAEAFFSFTGACYRFEESHSERTEEEQAAVPWSPKGRK